jgi:hypothetical protein
LWSVGEQDRVAVISFDEETEIATSSASLFENGNASYEVG